MQTTGQASPEVQLTAEQYVGTGYQRLLTFEVEGGGFSLFGDPPAEVFLTAYGLMEFTDMAEVYPVDPALIERTAQWLLDRQEANGTWTDQVNDVAIDNEGNVYVCGTFYDTDGDHYFVNVTTGGFGIRSDRVDLHYLSGLLCSTMMDTWFKSSEYSISAIAAMRM